MGLRDRLRQALQPVELHVVPPRECNHATFEVAAQPVVQPACNDEGAVIGESGATGDATAVQLIGCTTSATACPHTTGVARVATAPVRRFRLSPADADRFHAGGWNDAEIAAFTTRHARLLAHGLTDGDADDLAEQMVLRDREGDIRRLCVECANFRGRRCRQAERAGVGGPEVGALALILQHCPAFSAIGDER